MTNANYHPRLLDGLIGELLGELPAVMVTGPRATGKTTTAERHAASVVHLDRTREATAFRADPDVALREYEEPILLDEWQETPHVLGAVKRAVDDDSRPGRFLLTGSVRADFGTATWPGTGRVIRVSMYGMTVGEQLGHMQRTPLLDRLATDDLPASLPDPPDLRGYVELALASGFPHPALSLTARARMRWLDGYVDELLTRDISGIDPSRDPTRLRAYFEAYALNTAGAVADSTLLHAAAISRRTALAYERLLTDLFIVDDLPAWTSNRLKRLSKLRKRYLIDPALLVPILQLDPGAVLRDGDLLGRVLETFVVAQLRAELRVCTTRASPLPPTRRTWPPRDRHRCRARRRECPCTRGEGRLGARPPIRTASDLATGAARTALHPWGGTPYGSATLQARRAHHSTAHMRPLGVEHPSRRIHRSSSG